MQEIKNEKFLGRQQGYVYIHEIEVLTQNPVHFKLHAIMLHQAPFCMHKTKMMRTSFTTLDIFLPALETAVYALKEAIPRFTTVEAEIWVDNLRLLPDTKETGIPRTLGQLINIEAAVMKCRA